MATFVALLGVASIGTKLSGAVPRDVAIEYRLGGQRDVEELRVAYVLDGEEVAGARFEGPPARLSHELSLSPGRYRIEALVREGGAQRVVRRALRVPAEGVVLIDLSRDQRRLQAGSSR